MFAPSGHISRVSIRVQKEDAYLNPDLECGCNSLQTAITPKNLDALDFLTDMEMLHVFSVLCRGIGINVKTQQIH